MPKQNPKHIKKKVAYTREKKFSESSFPYRYVAMISIFVVAIVGIVFLVYYVNTNASINDEDAIITIEQYDIAKIEYKLWADFDHDGLIAWQTEEPYQHSTFDTNVTKGGLINGFYYHVLGMKIGESDRFWLDANVDGNNDGIDDNTGLEVVSYATPGNDLYNMSLVFWVNIINVTKASVNQPAASNLAVSTTELMALKTSPSIQDLFIFGSLFK